jgi:hypothetical protein
MSGACSTNGGEEVGGKARGKEPVGRPRQDVGGWIILGWML